MCTKDTDCFCNSNVVEKFYRSPEWKHARKSRIKIDNYTCQVCGRSYDETSQFTVDHLIPRRLLIKDKWCDKTNLWTLCKECNGTKQCFEHAFF